MSKSEKVVLKPILPGWLTLAEIATLANVAVNTIRGYSANERAGFPQPAGRSGVAPLWSIEQIVTWLESRPLSPTKVEVREDGTLVVTKPSDYKKRKATGKLVQN